MIKPVLEGARRRFSVAAAEVGYQDLHQRAAVGLAVVASSAAHAGEVLDRVERFIWSHPDLEVIESTRRWMDGCE